MEFNPESLSPNVEYSHYVHKINEMDYKKKIVLPVFSFSMKILQKKHRILANLTKLSRLRVLLIIE